MPPAGMQSWPLVCPHAASAPDSAPAPSSAGFLLLSGTLGADGALWGMHATARYYVTMDILRRVLEDYFGYTTTFVMNVTDVDDKIIRRARLQHLLQRYLAATPDTAQVCCHPPLGHPDGLRVASRLSNRQS